jgi:hypothetical protein
MSRFIGLRVPFVPGQEPFGIIHELRKQSGGNVHTKSLVEITASSTRQGNAWIVAARDSGWGSGEEWCSLNSPNTWIKFDFKNHQVSLESYYLKSSTTGAAIQAWVLEG